MQPNISSSTCSGFTPARFRASLTTMAPRSAAGVFFREPPNAPIAVRQQLTTYKSFILNPPLFYVSVFLRKTVPSSSSGLKNGTVILPLFSSFDHCVGYYIKLNSYVSTASLFRSVLSPLPLLSSPPPQSLHTALFSLPLSTHFCEFCPVHPFKSRLPHLHL